MAIMHRPDYGGFGGDDEEAIPPPPAWLAGGIEFPQAPPTGNTARNLLSAIADDEDTAKFSEPPGGATPIPKGSGAPPPIPLPPGRASGSSAVVPKPPAAFDYPADPFSEESSVSYDPHKGIASPKPLSSAPPPPPTAPPTAPLRRISQPSAFSPDPMSDDSSSQSWSSPPGYDHGKQDPKPYSGAPEPDADFDDGTGEAPQAYDPNAQPQEYYDPNAYVDPNAAYAPQGYDQQVYDPNAYADPNAAYADPNAAYDQQAYDQNAYPPQQDYNYNQQGYDQQAYDPNAYADPNAAYDPNAAGAYDQQGYAPQGYDPNAAYAQQPEGAYAEQPYAAGYGEPEPVAEAPPPAIVRPQGTSAPGAALSVSALNRSAEPEPVSAPKSYHAPSVADLAGGSYTPPEPDAPPSYQQPESTSDLAKMYVSKGPDTPQAVSPLLTGDSAVDRDGKPRFVPTVPSDLEDTGNFGRRVAGVSWIIFGLLGMFIFFLGKQLNIGAMFFTPMVLLGALMVTGARWTTAVGIFFSLVYAAIFGGAGAALLTGNARSIPVEGFDALPLAVSYGFFAMAVGLLAGSPMMLAGSPAGGRAFAGLLLVLLPQIGTIVIGGTTEGRPLAKDPIDDVENQLYGGKKEGFVFRKPDGWQLYDWSNANTVAPVIKDLVTEPTYTFLNVPQTMAVLFYEDVEKKQSTSILDEDERSDLEKEISREFSAAGEATAVDLKPFKGTQTLYQGATPEGITVSVLIDRLVQGDRTFLIAVIRDDKGRTKPGEESEVMDLFLEEFGKPK